MTPSIIGKIMCNILKKFLLFLFILSHYVLFSEHNVAVIIGNSRYPKNLLSQIESNVDIIIEALDSEGYLINHLENLNKEQLVSELKNISNALDVDSDLLVYYSGFMLDVNGTSYLIPSDARPRVELEVAQSSIELKSFISSLLKNRPNKSIFYFDPIGQSPRGYQKEYSGINELRCEEITKEANFIVAYNTSPYSVVDNKNSKIFSQSIVNKLQNNRDDFLQLMKEVRFDVSHRTFGNQKPWYDLNIYISNKSSVKENNKKTVIQDNKPEKSITEVAVKTSNKKSETTKNSVKKITSGNIKVLSDRSGTIYIDGKYMGKVTANTLKMFSDIKSGNRRVKMFYSDNKSYEQNVDIESGLATYVNFITPKKDYGFWLDMGLMVMEKTVDSEYESSITGTGPTLSLSWNLDDYFQWGLGTGFLVYDDDDGSNTIPAGFVSFALGDKLNSVAIRGQLGIPMGIGFNIKSFYLNYSFIPDDEFYGIQMGIDLNVK